MTSRVQKLRGKDENLLDEDKFRPTDERGTEEVTEFDAATARRQYHWDTRRTSLSVPPVRYSEVREGHARRYVRFTLSITLGNNYIFSTSGYFETTRSPSRLVFEAGWPGTSLS